VHITGELQLITTPPGRLPTVIEHDIPSADQILVTQPLGLQRILEPIPTSQNLADLSRRRQWRLPVLQGL
jgi:hypothetical protein